MAIDIQCFTSFYLEKDQPAVCGIVLTDGDVKRPYFTHKPAGDYLNGLLELLIERIQYIHPKLEGRTLHLYIHIHHKNKNFKSAVDKVIKSADTARGYENAVRDNVIKHTLTRRNYHKPACYEKMAELVRLLLEVNDPTYCVTLTTCGDSKSPDQLAVYAACQGEWSNRCSMTGDHAAQPPMESA
ncbi:MAG: hypothetical protein AB7Q04_13465 [Steroidobacteraceae bacterium]